MQQFDTIVVGAGIGGLAAALRLAAAGARVLVVERSEQVGGKMRVEHVAGRAVDAGPTVLTMRDVFDDLFEATGAHLDDYVTLQPLELLARHAWTDGSRLDLFTDEHASAEAIRAFAGPDAADGYRRFRRYAAEIHDTVEEPFMHTEPSSLMTMVRRSSWKTLRRLSTVDWHRTMWKALGDFFPDPRLRQLFARYATYYGSSPFAAPATLNLIAHVEARGVWTVEGGMAKLARAIAQRLYQLGGAIVVGQHVERIEVDDRGRAEAVVLADGSRFAAPTIVFNGDPHALATGRLGDAVRDAVKLPRRETRSLSAVTFATVAQTADFPLARHNVFFSDDYRDEFVRIFDRGAIPETPTVYVCAQDRETGDAVPELERMLVLINAPARGDDDDFEVDPRSCMERTLSLLQRCGLNLRSEATITTTPRQFAARFPATSGALYGPATHGPLAAFSRPGPRSTIEGLYLVGGGVHPGAGVPMVATSGRLAAEAVLADRPSMPRSRPVATFGGTWTASPTTAATP